jgi:parafibromin
LRREDSTGDYLKGCRNQGVGFVSTTDRKLVVEYLNGKTPVQGPDTRIRSLNDQEKELTRKVIPDLGQEGQDLNELMGGRGGDFSTGKRDATQRGDESGSTTTTGGATGGDVNSSSGSGGNLQPPPMKKARYTPDKLDQEKVKKMLAIMEGPTFNQSSSTNLHEQQASSSSSTTKIDRLGGGAANHTRETVLRGERYNVSFHYCIPLLFSTLSRN